MDANSAARRNVCLSYSYKVAAFATASYKDVGWKLELTEEKRRRNSRSHVGVSKTEDIELNGCEVTVQAVSRTQLSYMYVVTPKTAYKIVTRGDECLS